MKTLACLSVLAATAAITEPAAARSLALDSASSDGIVVLQVEPIAGVLPPYFGFDVETARFKDGHLDTGSIRGGWATFKNVGAREPMGGYVAIKLKPGDYAISALTLLQDRSACFNGGTFAYTVKPGTVTFIGRLDARPTLTDLIGLRKYTSRIVMLFQFDKPRPGLTPPSALPDWDKNVRTYLASDAPKVTAPIVAADLRPVTFDTGESLIGVRECYGFHVAKDDGAAVKQKP